MSDWIIYASEKQTEPSDFAKFEQALEVSGLRVSCDPSMRPGSKKAFIHVRDPRGNLEDKVKGDARCELLGTRVRALIRRWRQALARDE